MCESRRLSAEGNQWFCGGTRGSLGTQEDIRCGSTERGIGAAGQKDNYKMMSYVCVSPSNSWKPVGGGETTFQMLQEAAQDIILQLSPCPAVLIPLQSGPPVCPGPLGGYPSVGSPVYLPPKSPMCMRPKDYPASVKLPCVRCLVCVLWIHMATPMSL